MNGILLIDKPAGLTSHDVVARVRRILKTKRVGHTGTLDPFATGLLVLLVGQATRLARFIDKDDKEYIARLRFGFETDSGDFTGTPTEVLPLDDSSLQRKVLELDWSSVLSEFTGASDQVPPMFSAKKVDGSKLYELARRGEVIERAAAKIRINSIEKMPDEDANGFDYSTIRIKVSCSAGTYIRTLASDIGRSAGLPAHLTELRRTRAGQFLISDAVTLEKLGDGGEPAAFLLPLDRAVKNLPSVVLSDERIQKTQNGMSTRIADAGFGDMQHLRVCEQNGNLVAIGVYFEEERSVRPVIVLDLGTASI